MKKQILIISALFSSFSPHIMADAGNSEEIVSYTIKTSEPQQTMEYFSASDAWSMLRIGLWPKEKQEQIADWLFSTENESNGQPKGI